MHEWSMANAMNCYWDWEILMVMLGNVRKDLKYSWRVRNREKKR